MKLVISGASGFIGSALVERLTRQGHSLYLLSRTPPRRQKGPTITWVSWNPGAAGD
ncbi:MAG: NAD-dependent epimerase/dehydratase family protein, partial [Candidatus Binatia bacterium]